MEGCELSGRRNAGKCSREDEYSLKEKDTVFFCINLVNRVNGIYQIDHLSGPWKEQVGDANTISQRGKEALVKVQWLLPNFNLQQKILDPLI